MKTKFLISLLIAFFTVAVLPAQINVDVKNKLNRKANQRANRKTDQAIDKGFDELEDGIGSLFSKKKKKNKKDKNNLESSNAENSEQENKQDFGDFTYLFPANGNAVAVPIHCSWVLPDMENPTFTVYLEGDDWSDWLTKTTQDNEVFFDNLPTAATNFRWRVVAEAAGEKTASPWQSFSITDGTDESATTAKNETQTSKPKVVWAKFDFVPGDEVIFEDAPSADEENGEFPSRWDLHEGGAEVAEFNGTPVIMFLDDGGSIIPYLKNSNEDYLPEIFTVEMDVWFGEEQEFKRYWIELYDRKNQKGGETTRLVLYPNGLEYGNSNKTYPGREDVNWGVVDEPQWRRISIAYTKGKFKAYMDDTRLINIPRLEGNPTGITIKSEPGSTTYIKNIRIAKGGVKYYERVLSDGKIIVNGIRFDVNKTTIKPESNGAINEIFELMQKQTDLNFSVEGHTDSDGDDAFNQTLSEQRAEAVMDRLVSMGISSNRLKSAGWGESKPIGGNDTAEGKANNRRVEFVKF